MTKKQCFICMSQLQRMIDLTWLENETKIKGEKIDENTKAYLMGYKMGLNDLGAKFDQMFSERMEEKVA